MAKAFPPIDGYLADCKAAAKYKLPLKKDAKKRLENIIKRLRPSRWAQTIGKQDFDAALYLRKQKREFDYIQSYLDHKQWLDFATVGLLRTRFADATINFALAAAIHHEDFQHYYTDIDRESDTFNLPGLFVLGLGKLGGYDLNFSSDIDLIAYFDQDLVPIKQDQGIGYVCVKILQHFSGLLSDLNEDGFVWRVDWRLRPEASANPIAISTDMAEEFYRYRALPWHRLALCKARVVAGDLDTGAAFLQQLNNYIWVRNLDYRSFDDLRHIKKRINDEHPGLETQREQENKVTADAAGFNLKLGRGGIREIEFIVNALQLVWGGRKHPLQVSNTLQALQTLSDEALIDAEIAKQLKDAYVYLRGLENRVQMLDNEQRHHLPDSSSDRARLMALHSQDWRTTKSRLFEIRKLVAREFEQMFRDENSESSDKQLPAWITELDSYATDVMHDWHAGFLAYGIPNTLATSFAELFARLIELIDKYADDKDRAIRNVDEFFHALPPGGQYFRLMTAFPHLLEQTIPPIIQSPLMTHLLRQSPHIVDALIEHPAGLNQEQLQSGLQNIESEKSYEVQLNGLRRFINEQLYAAYQGFLAGTSDYQSLTQTLTELAEQALHTGLNITVAKMGLEKSPLAVLALGKMGMSCMSPGSDLDLIYVADKSCSIDLANDFSNRMHTLMAAQMREGVVYEMDMRLRPSGASGPPTVGLKSFRGYHRDYARTWEHLALVPARFVAGDTKTGKSALAIRAKVLAGARDTTQMLNDAAKMYFMIKEQRNTNDPEQFNIKLREGGLLEAEYLANVVILSALSNEKFGVSDFDQMAAQGLKGKLLKSLHEAIVFWRPLQVWERLLGLSERTVTEVPKPYRRQVLASVNLKSVKELEAELQRHSENVLQVAERVFAKTIDKTDLEDWPDDVVRWKKK